MQNDAWLVIGLIQQSADDDEETKWNEYINGELIQDKKREEVTIPSRLGC